MAFDFAAESWRLTDNNQSLCESTVLAQRCTAHISMPLTHPPFSSIFNRDFSRCQPFQKLVRYTYVLLVDVSAAKDEDLRRIHCDVHLRDAYIRQA